MTILKKCDIISLVKYQLKGGIFLEIKLNNGVSGNTFGVPCVVADNLLKIADGEYIKVLLYILRNSGKICSEDEISDNTGANPETVRKAIKFWQQANVIVSQQNVNTSHIIPDEVQKVEKTIQEILAEPSLFSEKKHWTGTEIRDLKMSSPDVAELISAVQSILGAINTEQLNSILNMHETLGMKKEVIMTLIGYCKEMNKTNPEFIYNVACKWISNNINTLEQADNEVQHLKTSHDYICQVMKFLNISRITKEQEKMISEWSKWNITIDMVEYAYEISLPICQNKLSIGYINGIITNWHDKNINTFQEALKADELRKQENIQKYGQKGDYLHNIMQIFNIRQLAPEQESLIKNWENWNINTDMVKYAYEISLPRCQNNLNINYINGIIKDWHERNITTLQDAQEKYESNKGKKKHNKKNSNFNIDMYKIFVNDF